MTTLAVLADLHLPDARGSAQHAVLDWAIGELKRDTPELLVALGDMTACGEPASATELVRKLREVGLPLLITPGNSDRRTKRAYDKVAGILHTPQVWETEGLVVVAIDSSEGLIAQEERKRATRVLTAAAGRTVVLATHHDLDSLEVDSRAWLEELLSRRGISLIVAGHKHRDLSCQVCQTAFHLVRGLDPDKAIGGPPALTFFEELGSGWRRWELVWPGGSVDDWSDAECQAFAEHVGVSCIGDPLAGIDVATELGVPCAELRADAIEVDEASLRERLAAWRRAGGEHLSWHMPTLGWSADGVQTQARKAWRQSLSMAVELGAQALTVHTPKVRVGLMEKGSGTWCGVTDAYAEELAPAVAAGLRVGIENMHMAHGEADDGRRRFGCTPEECAAWVAEMRQRLGDNIGFLLDVGHARNNPPFSKRVSVGQWYARMGTQTVAYHLHQVLKGPDGRLRNHQPIPTMYGPFISFSSFLWGWHTGQLNRCPILLEIRDLGARVESLNTIRAYLDRRL